MSTDDDLRHRFLEAIDRGEPIVRVEASAAVERSFAEEVAEGLAATPRRLPTRFLYDAEGSRLFEEITEQPEYYPTRTEEALLERCSTDVARRVGDATLVELGSGYSVKTAHVLRAFDGGGARYVAIDVSEDALRAAHASIAGDFPNVRFSGVVGSFDDAMALLPGLTPKLVMFLGSTLGNLDEDAAGTFFEAAAAAMAPGDHFLLGVDLVKDPAVVEAAYDDARGVTAAFTKNYFVRMNRELGTDLDVDAIAHEPRWSAEHERIETYARFDAPAEIELEGRRFRFEAGERVLVEISRKYRVEPLTKALAARGLELVETYRDERDWYALLLLRRA